MKSVFLMALLFTGTVAARAQGVDANVNERYTVESVEVQGVEEAKLGRTLREDIHGLVGKKLSQERLDELSHLIRRAFPGRSVAVNVSRGTLPDHVKVTFNIHGHTQRFDLSTPKQAVYNSRLGWNGEVDAAYRTHSSRFLFGVLSDGESLVERFAGLRARYENSRLGTDRLGMAFEFSSYHQMWNGATTRQAFETTPAAPEIYRTRQNFEPTATLVLARPLRLTFGVSFERFQIQFPAAHTEAANSAITTLRYDRLLEESGSDKQRVEAGYSLRAATKILDSDYVYARHTWDFGYTVWRGHHQVGVHFRGGLIAGHAPFFERFVLGNSTTLRGWNKYDLAPLGADRMVHNSLEYRYRAFQVFYDVGAVWSHGETATARHSAGAGLRLGDLALLVAFPIRNGRADPVFIAGLNL